MTYQKLTINNFKKAQTILPFQTPLKTHFAMKNPLCNPSDSFCNPKSPFPYPETYFLIQNHFLKPLEIIKKNLLIKIRGIESPPSTKKTANNPYIWNNDVFWTD